MPTGGALPACADLADNDGDGRTDLADTGCTGPLDIDEYNPPPAPAPGGGSGSAGGSDGGGGQLGPGAPKQKGGAKQKGAPASGIFGVKAPKGGAVQGQAEREKFEEPSRSATPTARRPNSNPSLTIAQFGAAPIGVPNFVIDQFEIPPFLLPIYQACGTEYGVPWQVLASINRIETAFGTNLNVSSAGRPGLDAVHPLELEGLRGRRQRGRAQGPLQPRRRDLRRRPLPEGRRRRGGPARRDLRLQPRRLVRGRGPALRQPVRASSPTTWSAR